MQLQYVLAVSRASVVEGPLESVCAENQSGTIAVTRTLCAPQSERSS